MADVIQFVEIQGLMYCTCWRQEYLCTEENAANITELENAANDGAGYQKIAPPLYTELRAGISVSAPLPLIFLRGSVLHALHSYVPVARIILCPHNFWRYVVPCYFMCYRYPRYEKRYSAMILKYLPAPTDSVNNKMVSRARA